MRLIKREIDKLPHTVRVVVSGSVIRIVTQNVSQIRRTKITVQRRGRNQWGCEVAAGLSM
jgi:hypothetical protein